MSLMGRSAFVPTFFLALIFISAKAELAAPLIHAPGDLAKLIGASAEDVAVGVAIGVVTSLALWATARRPTLQKIAWRSFVLIGAIAAAYSVANIGIFRSLG